MAYKTADLLKKSIEAITEHKLVFIEEVVHYLPCSKQTFYAHKLDESPELKNELDKRKIQLKHKLRAKWYASASPVLQIALYKLLATPEERSKLVNTGVDVTSGGDSLNKIVVSLINNEAH